MPVEVKRENCWGLIDFLRQHQVALSKPWPLSVSLWEQTSHKVVESNKNHKLLIIISNKGREKSTSTLAEHAL